VPTKPLFGGAETHHEVARRFRAPVGRGSEPVADPRFGDQVLWPGQHVFELRAERVDERLEQCVASELVEAPQSLHLLSRQLQARHLQVLRTYQMKPIDHRRSSGDHLGLS